MNEIFIIVLIIAQSLFAATAPQTRSFYFSTSAGDDSRAITQAQNQSTPWKSLAKISTLSLIPGDQILLKSGDTFPDPITFSKLNGSKSAPIKISSYSTGHAPVIIGAIQVIHWVKLSNGIWVASRPSNLTSIYSTSEILRRSRYPSDSEMKIDSAISPKCFHLKSNLSNGFNASIVEIHYNDWSTIQIPVVSKTSNSFCIDTVIQMEYFPRMLKFVNHPSYLTKEGDWAFTKDSIYLIAQDEPQSIYGITDSVGVKFDGSGNIVFNGINIIGFSSKGLWITGLNKNITISDVSVSHIDNVGIQVDNADSILLYGCQIHNAGRLGINSKATHAVIRKNTVSDIGINDESPVALGWAGGCGLVSFGANSIIDSNRIREVAYNGLYFYGINHLVKNNVIQNFCKVLTDGGGIYTFGNGYSKVASDGSVVESNLLVIDNRDLIQGAVNGIYMDEHTVNVSIHGNILKGMPQFGFHLHKTRGISLAENVIFDSKNAGISFQEDMDSADIDSMSKNILFNNLIISLKGENAFKLFKKHQIISLGHIDSTQTITSSLNSYNLVNSDSSSFSTNSQWKSLGYDLNGTNHSITIQGLLSQANLISNGQYSTDVSKWTVLPKGSQLNWVQECAVGAGCARVDLQGSTGSLSSPSFAVTNGQQYLLKFKIKGSASGNMTVTFRKNGGDNHVIGLNQTFNFNEDTVTLVVTASETQSNARLDFSTNLPEFFLDDVSLQAYTPPLIDMLVNDSFKDSTMVLPAGAVGISGQPLEQQINVKPLQALVYIVPAIPLDSAAASNAPSKMGSHFY